MTQTSTPGTPAPRQPGPEGGALAYEPDLSGLGAARVAEPDEAVSFDELQLATRNHGLPLEALRYDVTPVGMHYTLVHYDVPFVDAATWRLEVTGRVAAPLSLSLEDLHARERVTRRVTLECAGNGRARLNPRPVSQPWLVEAVGTAEWTGTPLAPLLREAGVLDDAVDVAFTGADHGVERGVEQDYARGLALVDALDDEVLLAYEVNGQPLPPQHGFPLRLLVPGWYGMTQVKWLRSVEVLDHAFDGFQNVTAYRRKVEPDEPGEPVTRIEPRALVQPPGFPDFMTRTRVVDTGTHLLHGRAWSGWGRVTRVEVSTDGGRTWVDATLDDAPDDATGRWAWRGWTSAWQADEPGAYTLTVRAHDETGRVQPADVGWNRQGMADTGAQRVPVLVRHG